MTADLTNPIFNDEDAARAHFEDLRWPYGPICPHCRTVGQATEMKGKTTRPGLYKCRACRKPFTATMGTLFERSHVPMHKWLLATHLMAASRRHIGTHQLWRMLGVGSYRTARLMAHRIREGIRELFPETSDNSKVGQEHSSLVDTDTTSFRRRKIKRQNNKRIKGARGGNRRSSASPGAP